MHWKFWNRRDKKAKSIKPKDLPEAVGRKMVVAMKLDPDEVWSLKYISRAMADHSGIQEFRIFDPDVVICAGITVSSWESLDDHMDLVRYSGSYDKSVDSIKFNP